MKTQVFACLLALMLLINPTITKVYGMDNEKDPPVIEIEDEETPQNPKKERKNYLIFYFTGALTIIVIGAIYLKLNNNDEIKLNLDLVEDNGDGSYTIHLGYESTISKPMELSKEDYGIRILKGNAIMLKTKNTSFTKGKHKNEIIAVVNEETELEFYVQDQKILIKGKDLRKGALKSYE